MKASTLRDCTLTADIVIMLAGKPKPTSLFSVMKPFGSIEEIPKAVKRTYSDLFSV